MTPENMMRIVKYPDPILLRPTEKIEAIDDEIRQLAADMLETMYQGRGVGLSANQVGRALHMAVINPTGNKEDEIVVINPEIVASDGKAVEEEGCLSFPGLYGKVARAKSVTVHYTDLDGNAHSIEAQDFLARIFQHEIDHLNGVVFVSKLRPAAKIRLAPDLKRLETEYES